MARTLREDAFVAMYQVAQEKYAYLERMQEWERKSGLARLFTKPRDPFPDVQEYDTSNLLQAALQGSFPELDGYKGDRERPDKYRCSVLVYSRKDAPLAMSYSVHVTDEHMYHQEEHAYRKGYGFVDTGYSEKGTAEQVARNRNTVYSRRRDGRAFCGDTMVPYFKRLDYVRETVARRIDSLPKYSRAELRAVLRDVMAHRAEVAEERRAESLRKPVKVDAVESLDGFIDVRMRMAKIAYDVSRGNVENTPEIREEFKFLEEAGQRFVGKESDRLDVTLAGEEIALRKRRNTGFGTEEAEALCEWLMNERKDGEDRVYFFARYARDFGMSAEGILDMVRHRLVSPYTDLADDAARIAFRAIRRVDEDSVKNLEKASMEAYYRNDRRIIQDSLLPADKFVGTKIDIYKSNLQERKEPSAERSETKEESKGENRRESVRETPVKPKPLGVKQVPKQKKAGGVKL